MIERFKSEYPGTFVECMNCLKNLKGNKNFSGKLLYFAGHRADQEKAIAVAEKHDRKFPNHTIIYSSPK